jgi:phosphatidylserine/phosphatidylglycerophosphate/cardiolipin synthase-like enzyme
MSVDLYYNSNCDLVKIIIEEIKKAKKEIYVLYYLFTWKPIADELIKKSNDGVDINILVNKRSLEKNMADSNKKYNITCVKYLHNNGIINIRVNCTGMLHHKTIMIDNVLILGTFNLYRWGINKSKDYIIKINNEPTLIQQTKDEFKYRCKQSKYIYRDD